MILVTGGLGFIGLHTARALLDAGEDVVLTRHRRGALPSFLAGQEGTRLRVEPADSADADRLAEIVGACGVDGIVHLAGPPRSGIGPVEEMRVAIGGLLAVLEAAQRCGVPRVSVASSLAVYGHPAAAAPGARAPREDQPLPAAADHPIQAAKLAEEAMGSYLGRMTGVEVVFLRIAGIYGPCYRTLLNAPARLCQLALGRGDRIAGLPDPLAAHPDEAFDLCYVKDCARAICLLHLARPLPGRVYNVGVGASTTMADLVAAVNKAGVGPELALRESAGPPPDHGPAMDIGRLRADVGFEPEWSTQRAVEDYLRWLRDHEV